MKRGARVSLCSLFLFVALTGPALGDIHGFYTLTGHSPPSMSPGVLRLQPLPLITRVKLSGPSHNLYLE